MNLLDLSMISNDRGREMKGMKSNRKLNNKGAALVTVIVVISFISILATMILYSAGINFTMKATDIKTKKGFYDGEQAVEEIKVYFTNLAQEAFEESYADALISGGGLTRETVFVTSFLDSINSSWNADVAASTSASDLLQSKIDAKYAGSGKITLTSATLDLDYTTEKCATLKGLEFVYTDSNNCTTKISTDIKIYAPPQKWSIEMAEMTEFPGNYLDLMNNKLEIADCVKYYNWKKK